MRLGEPIADLLKWSSANVLLLSLDFRHSRPEGPIQALRPRRPGKADGRNRKRGDGGWLTGLAGDRLVHAKYSCAYGYIRNYGCYAQDIVAYILDCCAYKWFKCP